MLQSNSGTLNTPDSRLPRISGKSNPFSSLRSLLSPVTVQRVEQQHEDAHHLDGQEYSYQHEKDRYDIHGFASSGNAL
jgi:hypothetical protein